MIQTNFIRKDECALGKNLRSKNLWTDKGTLKTDIKVFFIREFLKVYKPWPLSLFQVAARFDLSVLIWKSLEDLKLIRQVLQSFSIRRQEG